ncbi:MAG: peptidylprolyl isomerase [Parvibaculum sp.]
MKFLFRDPLTHFAGAGLVLFLLFSLIGDTGGDASGTRIHVDRNTMLTYIQYQTRNFDPDIAERRLAALSPEDQARLVDEYLREEVLYREGLSLGLEADDNVIRRRLIQKVEFLAEGFADAGASLTEQDLRTFFEETRADYYVQPSITFTHVFFDRTKHEGREAAAALETLSLLNENAVPFSGAPKYGDRFPFHVNYVAREKVFVASHFGTEMADAVFALTQEAGTPRWAGPFRSEYGLHLVMVTAKTEGREANFDEVRNRVAEEARRKKLAESMDQAVENIRARYEITVDLGESAE